MPPTTPEVVKLSLETEKKFTNRGDTSVVSGLYRSLFEFCSHLLLSQPSHLLLS